MKFSKHLYILTLMMNDFCNLWRVGCCVITLAFAGEFTALAVTPISQLTSPSGKVLVNQTEQGDGSVNFEIKYAEADKQTHVLTISDLGLRTQQGRGTRLKLGSVDAPEHLTEKYTMLTGKRRECGNEANEYRYHFKDSLNKEVVLRMRLYNDGVAFRYELPEAAGDRVVDEYTTFRIDDGTKRWMQTYLMGYEDFYPMYESGDASDKREWSYPALMQLDDNVWTLLSESDITRKQSGSRLTNQAVPTDYKVKLFDNDSVLADGWHTPWRVLIVGSLGDVVESTLITDTSSPALIADTSWISPGNVSWIYWAHNHGSKDYQTVKQYIDMAAELNFPYVLIDWEWDKMENGGTIEDAVKYAHEKGIRPLLWYNSSTTWTDEAAGPLFRLNKKEDREKEFAWLKSIGVAGVKIDFFPEDTETTMAYYQDLLETAADYGLLVNFHGAAIPRGWQRTYPNQMSVEAVYGAEWYNNNGTLTNKAAAHNSTLPFTRNVIGPMDYTPCAFSDSQHPHITTHAHELALPVVFESALQHWADRPESYLAQPEEVKTLMGLLPTAWDDTKLVAGYPGEFAVMARRSGNKWFIGGLNGSDSSRTLPLNLEFITDGTHKVTMFEDSGDKENPWKITIKQIAAKDFPSEISCQPRGGFVAIIE